MPDVLSTPRLSLRRPEPADIDAMLAVIGNPETTRHDPGDLLTSRAAAEHLYAAWAEVWTSSGVGYLVIRRRDEPDVLGFCGVKPVSRGLNLYYRLAPPAWGAGIATEAASAVLAWARASKPDVPVIARVAVANVASQRVLDKIGLHRTPAFEENGAEFWYA